MTSSARLSCALALLWLAACGAPTSSDIVQWKSAPDGAERLQKALKAPAVPTTVRAEAGAALVDLGLPDHLSSAVARLPLDDRARMIPVLVPLLEGGVGGPRAWEVREALFSLRQQATTDESRRSLDRVFFAALEKDLRAGRTTGGRHAVAEMLEALGPASVPTLLAVLGDATAPFAPAYQVLDKVGDKAAKEKGAVGLVKRARGGKLPDELWTALGTLGGKDAIAFLEERVAKGSEDEAERAASALGLMKREPALLPFALRVAGDASARPALRDKMLEVVRNVGGEEARNGLVKLIASNADVPFRFKAFKAAIKSGGGPALLPALEAFPNDTPYTVEAVQQNLVASIYEMGYENREGLFKALESRSAFARMAAVLTLEKSGFGSDGEHVVKLVKDRGVVKGFAPGRTVGAEAQRVAALLKKQE